MLLLAICAVLRLGFHVVSSLIYLLVVATLNTIVWGMVERGAATVSRSCQGSARPS